MKTIRARSPAISCSHDARVERIAADQPVAPELPDIAWPAARRSAASGSQSSSGSPGSSGVSPSTRLSISAIEKPVTPRSKPRSSAAAAPSAPRPAGPRPSRRSVPACCRRSHRPASRAGVIVSRRTQGTVAQAEQLRRRDPAVAGKDSVRGVDQHRVGEAERLGCSRRSAGPAFSSGCGRCAPRVSGEWGRPVRPSGARWWCHVRSPFVPLRRPMRRCRNIR